MKRWTSVALKILAIMSCVYAMVFLDLVLRSRTAYLEGEKYYNWHHNPSEKKVFYLKEYEKVKKKLDGSLSFEKITRRQYNERLELAGFERDQAIEDSSIKYAYIWYQTALELFAFPESKWVRLSKEKMLKARQLWKEELKKKNIPFQEYMLD